MAVFPDPRTAPGDEPLAWGRALSADLVAAAYREGIFPWYSEGEPVLWWSTDPRCVLFPEELRITDSLRKTLKKPGWRVTCDTVFDRVIRACADAPRPGQDGTWITPAIMRAYGELHRRGVTHSVEVWWEGELVGGLYGVAVGRVFCGESMFHRRTDASKVALVYLCERLRAAGFVAIDCQQATPHLLSLGARPVPRAAFLDTLHAHRDLAPGSDPWAQEPGAGQKRS